MGPCVCLHVPHPVSQSIGEAAFSFAVGLEELVGEMLSHESKHQIGSLGIGTKLLPPEKPFGQQFHIWQDWFPCRRTNR